MSKQTRWIQVAVRAMSGKGSGAIGPLEKAKNLTNNTIQQRYRIPNAVQLGHTLPCLNGGKERSAEGAPISWPGLCIAPHALPNRGSILEICSPGLLCRNAASQVALAESRLGQVLWLSVGAHPELAAGCGLDGVRNLTLRRWPIATAADSKAALQHLLGAVRSQAYSLVVLDHVAGLAPPLTAPGGRLAAPAPATSAAAGAAAAADVVGAVDAAPGLVGVAMRAGAAPAPAAAAAPGGRAARVNMKFLHHILPVLLEDTLAQLAASCGPDLGTTTLLLNTYSRPEQAWFTSGGGGGGERSRWARRAIVRHASATLHLLPDGPGVGGAAAAQRSSDGDNGGGGGGLHAVLTKGTATGEDGDPCFMGSLKLTVRHSAAPRPDPP